LSNKLIEQAQSMAPRYADALQADARQQAPAAAPLWDEAAGVYDNQRDPLRAVHCAREAVACTPDDFERHRRLANLLMAAGQYQEAVQELLWCLRRKPDDQGLRQQLETATRQRLSSGTDTTRQ
jgi:tetratricopeptide (TPR) repeat protein